MMTEGYSTPFPFSLFCGSTDEMFYLIFKMKSTLLETAFFVFALGVVCIQHYCVYFLPSFVRKLYRVSQISHKHSIVPGMYKHFRVFCFHCISFHLCFCISTSSGKQRIQKAEFANSKRQRRTNSELHVNGQQQRELNMQI